MISTLKELYNNTNNELQKEVIQYYLNYSNDIDEIKGKMEDVLKYGCVSGCVGFLIYYKNINDFYKKFEIEIWDLLHEEVENAGEDNILKFIASLGGAGDVGTHEQFLNLLAWFSWENVTYWIYTELGDF
jgi:single-stranded DNA-specific DHH superfamily exonuclease